MLLLLASTKFGTENSWDQQATEFASRVIKEKIHCLGWQKRKDPLALLYRFLHWSPSGICNLQVADHIRIKQIHTRVAVRYTVLMIRGSEITALIKGPRRSPPEEFYNLDYAITIFRLSGSDFRNINLEF